MSRPLFTRPDVDRWRAVRELTGEMVELELDAGRDGDVTRLHGTVLAAALPGTGTSASAVILADAAGIPRSYSTATVRSLRRLTHTEVRSLLTTEPGR
jgi:hypothetical protein